jgi:hypothetical protein
MVRWEKQTDRGMGLWIPRRVATGCEMASPCDILWVVCCMRRSSGVHCLRQCTVPGLQTFLAALHNACKHATASGLHGMHACDRFCHATCLARNRFWPARQHATGYCQISAPGMTNVWASAASAIYSSVKVLGVDCDRFPSTYIWSIRSIAVLPIHRSQS